MAGTGDSDNSSPIKFTVSAPGKLILFGEHSVVYGKSALAASINKHTFLNLIENSNKNMFTLTMEQINFEYSFIYDDVIIRIINKDILGNDLKPLIKSIYDPNDINYDNFVEIIEEYIQEFIDNGLMSIDKHQKSSLIVFLFLLHGIFYKDNDLTMEPRFSTLSPLSIDITSNLSMGSGTGSSASFCVCVAAALLHYKNIKLFGLNSAEKITFSEDGLKLISKWAFNGEKIIHGKPSGIDNTVATFGSFIEVKNTADSCIDKPVRTFLNLKNPPVIHVILINTGILRNTAQLVKKVMKLKSHNPDTVNYILNAMHEVSEKACQIIKDMGHSQANSLVPPDFELLEELVDINQGLLYSLGVSHHCLQNICQICSQHDLHAKLTGAGGGGYAFTLVPPNFDDNKLSSCIVNLQKHGYKVNSIELGGDGVKLENCFIPK